MSFGSQGPYYGGGGFMKNSPGGFGTQATPGGDGGNQKQGNRSLRPVNIAQVLESKQSNSENEWLIDGQPVTMISVVVHVHEVSMQTTADVYKVSDGSGQIEVRHWVESRSPDDMEADMEGSPLKGTYVKFVGMIRTFSDRKHINATLMRKVEDCNEVFFHFTEVMAVTMLNLHGPPGGSSYAGAAASSYSRQGGGEQVQYSHLPPLERAIYRFFVENPAPGDGYHVRQIMKAVKDLVAIEARNSDVDESTFFAAAIDSLTVDGVLYSTSDESHFALVD